MSAESDRSASPPTKSERYDTTLSFVVPDLESLLEGGSAEVEADELDSRYFDTENFDLLQRGTVLRCWTSNAESGWRLSRVADGERDILRVAFNQNGTTPQEVLDASAGLRLGLDVREVARVQVDRTITELLDAEGRRQLRFFDDTMRATAHGVEGIVSATEWRQLSLAADGEPGTKLVDVLGKQLRKLGAQHVHDDSMLARALAGIAPQPPIAAGVDEGKNPLLAYVLAQREVLIAADVALRSGAGDIHDTRVATRRLRSTLRNFAPALHATRARDLDEQLAWYARLLGEVRDREVLAERLLDAVAALPSELVLGPVAATIAERLQLETTEHRAALSEAMSSERYAELLRQVDVLAAELSVAVALKPRAVLLAMARAEGRTKRRLSEAGASADRDVLWHSARKAIKRARYAAELAEPVLGKKRAKAKIERYKQLQEVLGRHQDGVVAADMLRALGAAAAGQPGQNGFTFGLLYGREMATSESFRAAAAQMVAAL